MGRSGVWQGGTLLYYQLTAWKRVIDNEAQTEWMGNWTGGRW